MVVSVKTLQGKIVTVSAPDLNTIGDLKTYLCLCKQEPILWSHIGVLLNQRQCADADQLTTGALYHLTQNRYCGYQDVIDISDDEEEAEVRSLRVHMIDYFKQPGASVAVLLTRLAQAFKGRPKTLSGLKTYLTKWTLPECVGAVDDDCSHEYEYVYLQQIDALLRRCVTAGVSDTLITTHLHPLLDRSSP